MQDKWMNIGHEDDPLKPHIHPEFCDTDNDRISKPNKYLICILLDCDEIIKWVVVM